MEVGGESKLLHGAQINQETGSGAGALIGILSTVLIRNKKKKTFLGNTKIGDFSVSWCAEL